LAAAVRAAALDEVVERLPERLATTVGERGARLSGGERQRVGIARALYHDPDLLVLDEATSALDSVTEANILHGIACSELTTVIVAHRLSTIRDCERIVFLAGGRVVGTGSFPELVQTSAEFRWLVEAADSGEIDSAVM